MAERTDGLTPEKFFDAMVAVWGTGEFEHVLNPDMPWNEEIRATWARHERLAASPRTVALMMPVVSELKIRALLPTVRVPTLVVQYTNDSLVPPAYGKYVADHIPGAKYVELPGRNLYQFVEPWRDSFQEIAEFLTGHQADVADDRILATVLFTDIVDSTRRAAEMGDRDWHALLDAHDAVVRSQLARFRGREVNTSGDGFLAMFDGLSERSVAPWQFATRCRHWASRCAPGCTPRVRGPRRRHRRDRRTHRCAGERPGRAERGAGFQHAARPRDRVGTRVRGARSSRAQGRARGMAPIRRRLSVGKVTLAEPV
jgi:hypothetical protein